jgi:hypothetical protein
MIDRKLILANAPSNIGDQVHINHAGCPAGNDTKKRLYIKRSDRGLVAYCHHCNEAGFAIDNDDQRLGTWLFDKSKSAGTKDAPTIRFGPISIEGMVWLRTNHCNPLDTNFTGVQGQKNKVGLYLYDPNGTVIGWQVRNLVPGAKPKYLTSYFNAHTSQGDASWFYNGSKYLVITEDYLSAYRISRDTNFSSVALLKTTVSDKTLQQIHDLEFDKIFIWLDPDKAGKEGATKTHKKLTHYLPKETICTVLNALIEPKECTPKELHTFADAEGF